ncbi:MAG TPA: glycoside hydrolase family 3 N-terminal domain-containing protein [Ramlibacter sp.]|nr:glycoside hydrolase family 3 N-terminal domain-containing protein [Ramlibacter sp.]
MKAQVPSIPTRVWSAIAILGAGSVLLACGGGGGSDIVPPTIDARTKSIVSFIGMKFKDLDGDGKLTPYEDWRLSAAERAADLVTRMTLEEKAGMLLIDTLNAGAGGTVPANAATFINGQNMSRFIFRSVVTDAPPAGSTQVTPEQAARFTNAIQEMRENTRLGIPALFKSNARNHIDPDARAFINEAAGVFSAFPKEAGIAAAALGDGNMHSVRKFAEVMGAEWKSIGLRGMYGYMADLATEPRWYRVHETFTEDADLNADIMGTLVGTLQGPRISEGTSVNRDSAVALTIKHFPGGGPQEMGLDPHYAHGKNQVYPANNFAYHLKPFKAALEAGVSAVMPYYGVPINVTYEGVTYEQTGFAFSKQIVTDLLRGKLGFGGYVNSDTGIINDRAWGLEGKTVPQRVAAAINGGTEVLSGFSDKQTIIDLVNAGLLSQARVDEAVRRLLKEQFQLGLFENPYVDASKANAIIGQAAHREIAQDIQRKSVVLLQNQDTGAGSKALPLKAGAKVFIMGDFTKAKVETYGYTVTDGNALVGGARPSAAGHDVALISVTALVKRSVTSTYRSDDVATGMNPSFLNPRTGQPFGATDRCVDLAGYADTNKTCLDNGLVFGGALPWEADNLSFTAMAASQSWEIKPSLAEIKAIMAEAGAKKTVLHIYFRQPWVLDQASGLRDAGAIVGGFGVSDTALLDVLSGKVKPQGRMPFAVANNLDAVKANQPDAPGYPAADTLFPFGFGLTY